MTLLTSLLDAIDAMSSQVALGIAAALLAALMLADVVARVRWGRS